MANYRLKRTERSINLLLRGKYPQVKAKSRAKSRAKPNIHDRDSWEACRSQLVFRNFRVMTLKPMDHMISIVLSTSTQGLHEFSVLPTFYSLEHTANELASKWHQSFHSRNSYNRGLCTDTSIKC